MMLPYMNPNELQELFEGLKQVMRRFMPATSSEDAEESLRRFIGIPTPSKIPKTDIAMLLAGFRPFRRVPFKAFYDQEMKAIFEFMGKTLIAHKKLGAHDKLFVTKFLDSMNLNCVILDKVSKEKETLVDHFSKADLRREKVTTTLKKLEENKSAINSLQEKKVRLEKELLEGTNNYPSLKVLKLRSW